MRQPSIGIEHSGSRPNGVSLLVSTYGARVIDSTPPAIIDVAVAARNGLRGGVYCLQAATAQAVQRRRPESRRANRPAAPPCARRFDCPRRSGWPRRSTRHRCDRAVDAGAIDDAHAPRARLNRRDERLRARRRSGRSAFAPRRRPTPHGRAANRFSSRISTAPSSSTSNTHSERARRTAALRRRQAAAKCARCASPPISRPHAIGPIG